MRQHIRAETTKVESYNQFTDWIAFGGPVLRSGDPVEQEKRITYRDGSISYFLASLCCNFSSDFCR
jgi:hypothetical protein